MIGEYQDAEYFLTDNLRMINNKMEYRKNENSNFKPVLRRNWHILLEEYGWEKITKKWITQLNKLSDHKAKNSLYGVFDCESDGNCFFHCIAHALNEKYLGTELYYNSDDIRKMISDNLTPRALAILAQVKMVGMRLWFSMKLIAGRLNPVISANLSCEIPCSLRNRMNSFAIFSTSISNDLSLITDNHHGLALNLKRNYSYLTGGAHAKKIN